MKRPAKKGQAPDLQRTALKRKTSDEAIIRVVKLNASVVASARIRPVEKSVNVAVTSGPRALGPVPPGKSVLLTDPPAGWPTNLTWKPRRYFGPFWEGSDLSQIEVVVAGPSGANWYFNDYFSGHPDAAQYQPFFYGQTLPA